MRARFILSETWANLTRNLSMLLSLTLVTFISFLFIGASVLTQAQITKAKGDWYDKMCIRDRATRAHQQSAICHHR